MKKIIKSFFAIVFATFLGMVALSTQAAVKIETKGPVYDYEHTILKEGVLYQTYLNKPKKGEFKECQLFASGMSNYRDYKVFQCKNDCEYESKPTLAYSVYYMGLISLPYYSSTVGYIDAGTTRKYHPVILDDVYIQDSLSRTLSDGFVTSIRESSLVDFLKLDNSISETVSSCISSSISTSRHNPVSELDSFDVTIKESGFYLKQKRAIFKAYLVEEYDFSWNTISVITEQHKLHTDYIYKYANTPYTLTNVSMVFELKTDLAGDFFKYNLDAGSLVYAGRKENDNILYV
jgi:hypothetical protein